MKKKTILILGAAAALTLSLLLCARSVSRISDSDKGLFEANVEALADVQHWGSCEERSDYCQDLCSQCGKLVWVKGHQGPGKITRCTCTIAPVEPEKNDDIVIKP